MTEELKPVFRIKEGSSENDEGGIVVEKLNCTIPISISTLQSEIMIFEKNVKGATAQERVENATMENVMMNYPGLIEKVTEQEQAAIKVYYDALVRSRMAKNINEQSKETLDILLGEQKAIKEQTGIGPEAEEPKAEAPAFLEPTPIV